MRAHARAAVRVYHEKATAPWFRQERQPRRPHLLRVKD